MAQYKDEDYVVVDDEAREMSVEWGISPEDAAERLAQIRRES